MATFTASTRTIAGAPASTFEAADQTYGRQVVFFEGDVPYWGRVATFVSGTSAILQAIGNLPGVDKTVTPVAVLDLSEEHSYADYVARIKATIQPYESSKLTDDEIDLLLKSAVTNYSKDVPYIVSKSVTGTGSDSYLLSTILGALYKPTFTRIVSVEYPAGDNPPTIIEARDWAVYDDGSAQNGTNLRLLFLDGSKPSASESFVVRFSIPRDLPEAGAQNFPDTDETFENVVLLASSFACLKLAAAYAQSKDAVISADVVNYHDKTAKYTDLARELKKRYNLNVFGEEKPDTSVEAATTTDILKTKESTGRDFLFHGRRPWNRP